MLEQSNLSRTEKRWMILIFILLLVGLFLNLGIYPLTLEEPRRGMIALEMIFSDNWIVPTQTGELYFRKPPVYNWLLIFSYKLFGNYSEFATRFFSIVSFLLMGAAFYRFGKRHIGERFAAYSSLLFLISVDILYYFSTLGEIDLFYSLITLSVFIVIYDFGEKKRYFSLFILAYFLSAIGFLTKGLPSIPFLGISLVTYFILKKDFRRLFSIPHLMGGIVFLVVVGGYFWLYSQYADPAGWKSTLLSESSDRTTGAGFLGLLKHMVLFPADTIKNISPACLLLVFLFRKDFKNTLRDNPFILYLAVLFVANMLLYWVSIGARSRYVYALYPLIIGVLFYFFQESKVSWKDKFTKWIAIPIASMFIIVVSLFWIPDSLEVIPNRVLTSIVFVLIGIGILYVILKYPAMRWLMIISCFVMVRIGFSMVTPVLRAQTSGASNDKQYGLEIAEISKGQPLYLFNETDISRGITYYIEAEREDILTKKPNFEDQGFWICTPADTVGEDVVSELEFRSRDSEMLLVRKKARKTPSLQP